MTNLTDPSVTPTAAEETKSNGGNRTVATRITGIVKFYSVQKCYGFIKRDDTNEYVFVHSTSITGKNSRRVTRSVDKGERVEFEVVISDRSPEAVNVTGPNGGPVLGSEYGLVTMQWHQYDAYKKQLAEQDENAARDLSPRARRYIRKPGGPGGYQNRNRSRNGDGNDSRLQENGNDNDRSNQRQQGRRRFNRFNNRRRNVQNNSGDNEATEQEGNSEGNAPRPPRRRQFRRGPPKNRNNIENEANGTDNGTANNSTSDEPKRNQRGGRRSNNSKGGTAVKETNGSGGAESGPVLNDVTSAATNTRIAASFNNGNN